MTWFDVEKLIIDSVRHDAKRVNERVTNAEFFAKVAPKAYRDQWLQIAAYGKGK